MEFDNLQTNKIGHDQEVGYEIGSNSQITSGTLQKHPEYISFCFMGF